MVLKNPRKNKFVVKVRGKKFVGGLYLGIFDNFFLVFI